MADLVVITGEDGQITISQVETQITISNPSALVTVSDLSPVIEISESTSTITIYDGRGLTGKTGPQGVKGDPGGPPAYLDDMTDVMTISPADGDLLKYSSGLAIWTNTNQLDGGNF
ncbi:MAG: hypothetical protein EBU46_18450 [Nitrosomonadaceae bacterium]|nr:hypothetical protein [Nitrosomonadaceae bacterium]